MNTELISNILTSFWGITSVILFLGGSIFIHELGHFLAARKRGLKIERFSIGFGPKLFGWTKDGVDYRVSLLPFGGYVALPQLGDMGLIEGESDEPIENLPPISYTDKMIVSVMGAVANLIFAFILSLILWVVGIPSHSEETTQIGAVIETMYMDEEHPKVISPAAKAGLKPGDIILKVDDFNVGNANEVMHGIIAGSNRDKEGNPMAVLTINRNDEIMEIPTYPILVKMHALSNDQMRQIGIEFMESVHVEKVFSHSPAEEAGLLMNDHIISVDGVTVYKLKDISKHLQDHANEDVTLEVIRKGSVHTLTMRPINIPISKPLATITASDESKILQVVPMKLQPDTKDRELLDSGADSKLIVFHLPTNKTIPSSSIEFGDVILSVNDKKISNLKEFTDMINDSQTAKITFLHGNVQKTITLPANVHATIKPPAEVVRGGFIMKSKVITHPSPIKQFTHVLRVTYKILNALLHPKSDINISHLSGPVGIGDLIYKTSQRDFRVVVSIIVLLNINLAIINLLPIPVLDGGHMLIATINKLRRKKIPPMAVAYMQSTFMIIILCLICYLVFNDSKRISNNIEFEDIIEIRHKQSQAISLQIPFEEKTQ